MKKEEGQAAILIVFVLGMVSILIGLSLTQTGFRESLMGRSEAASAKAFYAADSGVEEAFYQIGKDSSLGVGSPATLDVTVADGEAKVTVSGTEEEKTIESVGVNGRYVRKLKVEAQNTSLKPGFLHAVQAGQGGFELDGNTKIVGKGGVDGNVYSNSSIWGRKSDHDGTGNCKNSSSQVTGSAWAVNQITKWGASDRGICVTKNATASNLDYCFVKGSRQAPNVPAANCDDPGSGLYTNGSAPTPVPLPNMGTSSLKSYVQKKNTFNGDCTIGVTPGCWTLTGGVKTIGDIYINGNLIKPNATSFNISGPIYVEGDINFGGGASWTTIGLDPSVNEGISQIVVAKGKIISSSNIRYTTSIDPLGQKMFLLFISDRDAPSGDACSDPSISIGSNADSVLFYATKGCVLINANSDFHGAILGEKIRVDNNSTVEYDPDLKTAIFGLTKSGGWMTVSFKEE